MTGYYAITARVERERDGWKSTRHLPTFYLHENVQGILNADAARKVAVDLLSTALDLAEDDSVQVIADAYKV